MKTSHFSKTNWEALARNLQTALETEIDESERLRRELDTTIEILSAHTLAIRYLKEKNGHDPV